MRHTTAFSSVLVSLVLLALASNIQVATAGGFDLSTLTFEKSVSTAEINETPELNGDDAQKKKGNSFASALTAPFRAFGRLFRGGKKNDNQPGRIRDKDAAKFETAKVTRIKDATASAPSTSDQETPPSLVSEFDAHLQKGRDLLMVGAANSAISELTTAISINAKSGEANKLLGIAYESKGLRDRALKAFEAALKSDSDNPEHLNNFGFLLYMNSDYERSAKYLKRAAKLSPKDSRIWNNLALTQCRRGKFDDGYQSFVKAVGEFDGHINIAAQLRGQGYAKDAIKHLELAQAMRPNSVDVLTRLVALYEMTGRPTDAESARRSLVALKTFADAK